MFHGPKERAETFGVSDAVLFTAGVFCALGGLTAMIAWLTHSELWVAGKSHEPIPYNVGFFFLLGGTGMVSLATNRRRLALSLGALLTFFAGLLLVGVRTSSWGMAAIFLSRAASLGTTASCAMAPNTALAFLLTGLSLLVGKRTRLNQGPVLIALAGALVLAIGGTVGLAAITAVPPGFVWGNNPAMPVEAALLFVCAGLGLAALAWRSGELGQASGMRAKLRSIPCFIGLGMVALTLFFWSSLSREEKAREQTWLGTRTADMREEIVSRLELQLAPLVRMANRWEVQGRPKADSWEAEAKIYLRHFDAFEWIAWVDDAGTVRWAAYDDEVQGASETQDQPDLSALAKSKELRRPLLVQVRASSGSSASSSTVMTVNLPDSFPERALYDLYLPLFPAKRFDGFLVGRIRARDLFASLVETDFFPGFSFTVSDGDTGLYTRLKASVAPGEAIESRLSLYGADWQLKVWPDPQVIESQRSYLASIVLCFGFLLAAAMVLLIQLFQSVYLRATERERVNLELAESEARLRRQATELTEARAAAIQQLKAQSEFLSGMRHELTALLAQLGAVTRELVASGLKKRQRLYVGAIQSWTKPLTLLLDDMADFQSAEEGRLSLAHVDFDLAELAGSVCEMFTAAAKEKRTALSFQIASGTPTRLRGDPERLRRIMIHMLDTALASLRHGEISIFIECTEPSSFDYGLRFEFSARESEGATPSGSRETIPLDFNAVGHSITARLVKMMDGEMGLLKGSGHGVVLWFTAFLEKAFASAAPSDDALRFAAMRSQASGERKAAVSEEKPRKKKKKKSKRSRLARSLKMTKKMKVSKPATSRGLELSEPPEESLLDEEDESSELMEAGIEAFLNELPSVLGRLRSSAVLDEWPAFIEDAEGIKAICEHLGVPRMAETCHELRNVAGPGSTDRILVLLKQLEEEYIEAREAIELIRSRAVHSRKVA